MCHKTIGYNELFFFYPATVERDIFSVFYHLKQTSFCQVIQYREAEVTRRYQTFLSAAIQKRGRGGKGCGEVRLVGLGEGRRRLPTVIDSVQYLDLPTRHHLFGPALHARTRGLPAATAHDLSQESNRPYECLLAVAYRYPRNETQTSWMNVASTAHNNQQPNTRRQTYHLNQYI